MINTPEVIKFIKELKAKVDDDNYLTSKSLQEMGYEMLVLSGQKRSLVWERWLRIHSDYTRCVDKAEDRGDLTIDEKVFDELKTRVLSNKEIYGGKLCAGNQIRLWQKLDNYAFITTNEDTGHTRIWKMPATVLKNLYLQDVIQFSSGHVVGGSVDKLNKVRTNAKVEWTFALNLFDYNYNQFEITTQF